MEPSFKSQELPTSRGDDVKVVVAKTLKQEKCRRKKKSAATGEKKRRSKWDFVTEDAGSFKKTKIYTYIYIYIYVN